MPLYSILKLSYSPMSLSKPLKPLYALLNYKYVVSFYTIPLSFAFNAALCSSHVFIFNIYQCNSQVLY